MRVKVTLIVFRHPDNIRGLAYEGYCPALREFYAANTVEEIKSYMLDSLMLGLEHRIHYDNLKNRGWQVSENSAIPPIFADEEAVKFTENRYKVKIVEPEIIVVDVELPKSRKRW